MDEDLLLPAKTALLERHPNAKKDTLVNLKNGYWRLEAKVYSLKPVMSFYVGLADSIEIQETKDSGTLKEMISNYVQEFILSKI